MKTAMWRSRWAAVGAALAVALGAGGLTVVGAADPADAPVVVTITPCRLVDTRPASQVGGRGSPISAGSAGQVTFQVTGSVGNCNIPADALGIVSTVTIVNPSASSFLSVFPGGTSFPGTSNLNWLAGDPPTPTSVTVDLGNGGKLVAFNMFGAVDLIIDIVAYTVAHDHDDRYYTQAQIDAMIEPRNPFEVAHNQNPKFINSTTLDLINSVSIVVPAGYSAVLEATYSSEFSCATTGGNETCVLDIRLEGGSPLEPVQEQTGSTAPSGFELVSTTRSLAVGAGTHVVEVSGRVVFGNGSITIDDRHLSVEAHLTKL